ATALHAMAGPASSSTFLRLVNVWRLLSLRSDVDSIVLELLGQFSLEKIYAEGDKEAYQQLVVTLLAQFNTIFYIQRLSLPSENLQVGWYLGFLASWEVTLRAIEFVLQVIVEGRESLWEARLLRDKYLAEFLLSALRFLTLHPKAPSAQRAKDRRDRFARVHRSLERIYDSYPGPKSFLLSISKDITDALRTDPNALVLPTRLRYELPNLASDLYPLADCLSSPYVSTIAPEVFAGDWLSQFLALRDVSQFVVGASVQYVVNQETRDVRLQTCSARTRNAVFHALDNLRIPSHLQKEGLVTTFSEMFRIILPDTPNLSQRASGSHVDENEIDAMDALCAKLNDRQVINRVSDREMMHSISAITRNIALLDDPSGQFRTTHPRLYAMNCQNCHLAGESQLKNLEELKFPSDPGEASEIPLPPQSKCFQCGDPVTMVREISLSRFTFDLLKPLEANADTVNVERHLPSQFHLAPPKSETSISYNSGYSNVLGTSSSRMHDPGPSSSHSRPTFPSSNSPDLPSPISQVLRSPTSPSFRQRLDSTARTEASPENVTNTIDVASYGTSDSVPNSPFSPDFVGIRGSSSSRIGHSSSSFTSFDPVPITRTRTLPLASPTPPSEKGPSRWRSKLSVSRKDSVGPGDTSSLSSATLEAQKVEDLNLKSLTSASKISMRGKSGKNINVYLSQNSTYALFWTQPTIHLWDLSSSPPTLRQAISTESTCLLAAVTKTYLSYIIRTQDQKLTLRIVNLNQVSVSTVEYRMPSSLWCRSMTICPKENFVIVGFENSIVRFFKTTNPEEPREERLHSRYHNECKECPSVDTLSFSNDGLVLLASTRSPKNGTIQVYLSRFPFLTFQELASCRYHVPLHESEDNGVSSVIFRSGEGGEEDLICISTWTQSGNPILIQPESGHRSDIKTDVSNRQRKLGSRIQCAAFSSNGRSLAMVNEKGHLYQISSLNSNPMEIRRVGVSKELTTRSDSYAMSFMTLPDEEVIVLAWADPSKATGYVKKIPLTSSAEGTMSPTAGFVYLRSQLELPAEELAKPPVELPATEKPATFDRLKERNDNSQASTMDHSAAAAAAPPPPPYSTIAPANHKTRNGIPPRDRRSMEDESRELPPGWIRQYDTQEHHQFFVETTASPPRSIWHHPYDDSQYMSSISPQERSRIQGLYRVPSEADIEAESSEDDTHHAYGDVALPPRPSNEEQPKGIHKLGRRIKDKITNSTHEEREQNRRMREEAERRAYEQHQALRRAMARAAETGQPQLLGKDRDGNDVFIEPPASYDGGFGVYGGGAYGYNPYNQGPYSNPNARFLRPQAPYQRPYGFGYGGGLGAPLLGLGGAKGPRYVMDEEVRL
ncbi:hypothetical protein B7494_g8423, partial [Chlorociboria aeruginascens]